MPAQGVDVYLDPWLKTQLEGHALCVQRIANIDEATHHAVTCQRWHVRFAHDQEITPRWVDPADFVDWIPPLWNTALYQFSLPVADLSQDHIWSYYYVGHVQIARIYPAIQMPANGRLRAYCSASHVTDRTGDPALASIVFRKNDAYWFGATLLSSDTICTKAYDHDYNLTGRNFAQGDLIDIRIQGASGNGDWTLVLQQNLLSLLVQWGTFP